MRALYWNGRELKLTDSYRTPEWNSTTALVQIHLAGICDTDLQIFKSYMDFQGVPGHEFVGVVNEGPAELRGKRVVGEINFSCGACETCRSGLGRHCPGRKVMGILSADGAFAEYLSVPVKNLYVVPDSISDEEAVFTEPLAAAFEILEQVQLDLSDRALVLGDGKLGFLCAQVLKLTGAGVTVLGKHTDKLSRIKKCGVRTILLTDWSKRLYDAVVDATGSASGLEVAMSAVRPRGTLVLKSTVADEYRVSLAPLVINEITVVGSRCGPFSLALEALAGRTVSVTPWIETIYPLDEGAAAVAHAARPGARKILLRP